MYHPKYNPLSQIWSRIDKKDRWKTHHLQLQCSAMMKVTKWKPPACQVVELTGHHFSQISKTPPPPIAFPILKQRVEYKLLTLIKSDAPTHTYSTICLC